MALRAGVFLNKLLLTAKLGEATSYVYLSVYHITDGKKGETFVSGVEKLDNVERFTRGYQVKGDGDFFPLPESRIRIHAKTLFNEGKLNCIVDQFFVHPKVRMERVNVEIHGDNIEAYVGTLFLDGESSAFGELTTTKSRKKNFSKGEKMNKQDKKIENISKKEITKKIERKDKDKDGRKDVKLASPLPNGSLIVPSTFEEGRPLKEIVEEPAKERMTMLDILNSHINIIKKHKWRNDYFQDKVNLSKKVRWPDMDDLELEDRSFKASDFVEYVVLFGRGGLNLHSASRLTKNMKGYQLGMVNFVVLESPVSEE